MPDEEDVNACKYLDVDGGILDADGVPEIGGCVGLDIRLIFASVTTDILGEQFVVHRGRRGARMETPS